MPAAGAISGGISALGSIFGGKGQAKSIKKAAKIQQQTAREIIAANDRTRAENLGILNPFIQGGSAAGGILQNALFGYSPQAASPAPVTQNQGGLAQANQSSNPFIRSIAAAVGDKLTFAGNQSIAAGEPNPATPAPQQGALSAFDAFRNSTNYQFRLNEGLKALNTGYAGKGVLESGAALRGINDYAQNTASNELGNWMDRLFQQQQLSLGAAGAATGQSIQLQQMNNQANQTAADARSNAALMLGQNRANMISGIANGLGGAFGSLGGMGGSSYGGGINVTPGATLSALSSFKGYI